MKGQIATSGTGHRLERDVASRSPACIGCSPAESPEAAELVRRSVEELGHEGHVSDAEVLGGEAEVEETVEKIRLWTSAGVTGEAMRRRAERPLRCKHADLHCSFPDLAGGIFDAWRNLDSSWESDYPGVSSEGLTRAVSAFLAVLNEE